MNNLNFGGSANAKLERGRKASDSFKPSGQVTIEQYRSDQLVKVYSFPNGVTNIGKDTILDSYFRNQAPPAAWYLGLINNAGYTGLDDINDTMASHTGWAEATGYSEVNRPTWVTTAAASQAITNPTPATFSITATATLKGVFVVTDNTKSGTTGVLWATALFSGDIPVANGDILKITYTVNAT